MKEQLEGYQAKLNRKFALANCLVYTDKHARRLRMWARDYDLRSLHQRRFLAKCTPIR